MQLRLLFTRRRFSAHSKARGAMFKSVHLKHFIPGLKGQGTQRRLLSSAVEEGPVVQIQVGHWESG